MDQPIAREPDEAELVRRARRGDHQAFAQLYSLHARAIHTLAHRLTGDPAAAQDVTQDAFMKMLQFVNGLRSDLPVRPWLKRVAANAAIDRLRRERHHGGEREEDWPGPDADPALHAETSGLLRRLPPLVRTVVWLHEMEGWSHQELAVKFGRSQSWSKSLLARALARLRVELDGEDSRVDD